MQAKASNSGTLLQFSMNFQALKITDPLQSLAMAAAPASPDYSRNFNQKKKITPGMIRPHVNFRPSYLWMFSHSVGWLGGIPGGTLPFN